MSTIISEDTALAIVDTENLSPQIVRKIDRQVDDFIARHKGNSTEINRLVFEGAAILTASEDPSRKMSTQGKLKRFWSKLNGDNARTQDTINANLVKAQYATQQILQKLADQQLLSFELIAAVNNSLNAQITDVNDRIIGIKQTLVNFFSGARKKLVELEDDMEKVKHKLALHDWLINIRNWKFDGVNYQDLDDTAKMICIVRDFLRLTGDKRYSVDFIYLETALENVGLPLKSGVNVENFIREVGRRRKLYSHMLGGNSYVADFATEYEPIVFEIRAANISAGRNFFPAQESVTLPISSDGASTISNEELAFELLYNLEQIKCAKESQDKYEQARELFMNCKIEEALPLLEELSADDARARYLLALIYNEGINVEKDAEGARKLLKENISVGEPCSVVYAHCETSIGVLAKDYKDACAKLQNPANAIERHALAKIFQAANSQDKAVRELERACESGFFLAAFDLGYKYYHGRGVTENNETARKYFERAAAAGHGRSMFFLGEIYFKGFGVPVNQKRAAEWFKKAYDLHARQGEYLGRIGTFYGKQGNYAEALKWYERGAEIDEPRCLYLAGFCYTYGHGTRKDFKKAANYLKRAVKAGYSADGDAEDTLGDIYWEGGNDIKADRAVAVKWYKKAYEVGKVSDGLLVRVGKYYDDRKDYSTAFEWYSRGAEKNFPNCLYLVGCCYKLGEGVDKNYLKAIEYLKRAIEAGHTHKGEIERAIGLGYEFGGSGLSANEKLAVEWYKKAYNDGADSDNALNCIGCYYYKQSLYSEAVKWFSLGAKKNYTYCLINLARAYRFGNGVAKDYSEAVKYCERAINSAASNGNSRSEIAEICDGIRERGFFEGFFG